MKTQNRETQEVSKWRHVNIAHQNGSKKAKKAINQIPNIEKNLKNYPLKCVIV